MAQNLLKGNDIPSFDYVVACECMPEIAESSFVKFAVFRLFQKQWSFKDFADKKFSIDRLTYDL